MSQNQSPGRNSGAAGSAGRQSVAARRLVIDARESGTSTGRYIDKLIEHLHELKPTEEVVILTKTDRLDFFARLTPTFRVVKSDYKEFTFAEQIGLLKQINSLKADLVHFPMVQQPVLYGGRVVTTMQDLTTVRFRNPTKNPLVFWLKQQVYKWVNKRVAKKSKWLITPSKFVKDDVVSYTGVSPSKITVTYEAADKVTAPPEPIFGVKANKFIAYVGRPLPHKNLKRLVEAFGQLKDTHPGLKLVLAGKKDSLMEGLEKYADQKGISGVVFPGFVSDAQWRWMFENCSAYVFPSLSEGFGLPGLEAMLYGAPVVSSSATCLPEIYGQAALYFDPENVDDMAAKLKQVLENESLRQELIKKGKKQAAKYSWAKMAAQTYDVYKKVLG